MNHKEINTRLLIQSETPDLIGESVPIRELREIIKQVSPTDVTILITGESGVGKEIVAKEIHKLSRRNNKPFITVNCGAIPEGIIESELFGHEKGSFTGAIDSRKGYFELADGGTIFLDEIGELPLSTQVKFLRVIETGEYIKVGGSSTQKVNVRVLAATNKNLEYQISINAFREDLYYRLRSINIYIPPLRERREDITLLFNHFVNEFCYQNQIKFKGITQEALDTIINFNWPGNVRQLKNFIESLITLTASHEITKKDVLKQLNYPSLEKNLPAPLMNFQEKDEYKLLLRALFELKTDIMDVKQQLEEITGGPLTNKNSEGFFLPDSKLENLKYDDIEQELLTYYWKKYNGNISKISHKLKISDRTLYRKYKHYGIRNGED